MRNKIPKLFRKITGDSDRMKGINVEVIPPLAPRMDQTSDVFDEGEQFSGIEKKGDAEACMTCTISPHTKPTVPITEFLSASRDVLRDPHLPSSLDSSPDSKVLLSPQVVIWWRKCHGEGRKNEDLDFAGIGMQKNPADFADIMASQTQKGVEIIRKASGGATPTIWGSWGFSTPEEREITGRGRGVPSIKTGHLHVITFPSHAETSSIVRRTDLSIQEQLAHIKPLGALFHSDLAGFVSEYIHNVTHRNGIETTCIPFSESRNDENGNVNIVNNGYKITLQPPLKLNDAYKHLSYLAADFEKLQRSITKAMRGFYTTDIQPNEKDSLIKDIASIAKQFNFSDEGASKLAEFSSGLHPTYGQLQQWKEELQADGDSSERLNKEIQRYDRLRKLQKESTDVHPILSSFASGVTADPDALNTENIWSERASATFIIDDYTIENGVLNVSSFRIIPGIDSTESAPEFMTGRIMRRS